jgi:uncharacterized membrane protein YjjP (DUF1212 family)
VPSERDERDAAATQFIAALGATMAAANDPVTMVRETMTATSRAYGLDQFATHSTAVFTATMISMMSIAIGVQTGLLLWRAAIQLTSSPDRRAIHD